MGLVGGPRESAALASYRATPKAMPLGFSVRSREIERSGVVRVFVVRAPSARPSAGGSASPKIHARTTPDLLISL